MQGAPETQGFARLDLDAELRLLMEAGENLDAVVLEMTAPIEHVQVTRDGIEAAFAVDFSDTDVASFTRDSFRDQFRLRLSGKGEDTSP